MVTPFLNEMAEGQHFTWRKIAHGLVTKIGALSSLTRIFISGKCFVIKKVKP